MAKDTQDWLLSRMRARACRIWRTRVECGWLLAVELTVTALHLPLWLHLAMIVVSHAFASASNRG